MVPSTILHYTNAAGNLCASFKADIVSETSNSPKVLEHGRHACTLELFKLDDDHYLIEWDIINFDTVHIGIYLDGNQVIDYDGVFDLPSEVVSFLTFNNFDLSNL